MWEATAFREYIVIKDLVKQVPVRDRVRPGPSLLHHLSTSDTVFPPIYLDLSMGMSIRAE